MKNKKSLILTLVIIFALNIMIISGVQTAQSASYKRGSYGSVVRQIQTILTNWGYYSGGVDGIFGSRK